MDGLYKGVSLSTDDLQAIASSKEILQKEFYKKFCLQNVEPDFLPILASFFFWIQGFKSMKFVTQAVRAQAQDYISCQIRKFSSTSNPTKITSTSSAAAQSTDLSTIRG